MAKRSIMWRWIVNSLGVILIILVAIEIGFGVTIRNYYYGSTQQYLSSKLSIITNSLSKTSQNDYENYSVELRNFIENFSQKEHVELMVINFDGEIEITSSGFKAPKNVDMTDYEMAKVNSVGEAYHISELDSGEKVMSYCVLVPPIANGDYEAIKIMTSLSQINNYILKFMILITVIFIGIIMIVILSGVYFIKSIVIPVKQISNTARQFAEGDFSKRIIKKNDDELGDLCDTINKMVDEISNSESIKNEFISSVSHELRTPLTAIKGWSETLNEIDDPDTIKKGMRVITSETQRLSQMVEELLDFSRIQDGRFMLQKDTMDILAELGEAVLIFQERAYKENIKIVYYEPEMIEFVYGDKNRIRQVFINIIDNAIKYSDSDGVVTIDAFEEENSVVITVNDTGCGISEEDLPKVKTKFYKANHTRRGSGIGLAVADEIIHMHGGNLDITSTENVGTTVRISLPVAPKKTEKNEDIAAL